MTSSCTLGRSGITVLMGIMVRRYTNSYPTGNWTFHTINQNLAGSPSEGNTGGTNHPNVTTTTLGSDSFNWMRELWKLANP